MSNIYWFMNQSEDVFFGPDGIWETSSYSVTQQRELERRDEIALAAPEVVEDLLRLISFHHSIGVMKHEHRLFIDSIPFGGVVLDVGAGWGWHWIGLSKYRPDLVVCILDMSRQNLLRAKHVLRDEVGGSFVYVCGDALDLKILDQSIDGYWSVQTLQHVPSFVKAVSEANRVLKDGGVFASYSLNTQPILRFVSKVLRRNYVVDGEFFAGVHLRRASESQRKSISSVFGAEVESRYTEILFSPEIHVNFPGRDRSFWGKLDIALSGKSRIARIFGRQCSFHTVKVG